MRVQHFLRELLAEAPPSAPPAAPAADPSPTPPPAPRGAPSEASLLQLYYRRLETLEPDATDISASYDELKVQQELFKRRYPVERLTTPRLGAPPMVSIVISVFKNLADLEALLHQLEGNTSFRDFEVVVLNDCPDAPIPGHIRNRTYSMPVTFLKHDWNAGFAVSNNLATRYAKGEYLLFLNSDIFPKQPHWLGNMVSSLRADPAVALVGAKTLFLASNRIEHFGMYPIYVPHADAWNNAHYFQDMEDGLFPETSIDQRTDMVSGAAMLIWADLFRRLDGFDESFLIGGFEDSDLCRRVRRAGYDIRVSAGAVLEHRKSASLDLSERYSDRIAECNLRRYNRLWSKTLHRLDAAGEIHHPFERGRQNTRVLFVAHGYPPEQIGGTEVYNRHLAEAVHLLPGFESVVLARRKLEDQAVWDGEIVFDHEASATLPVFRCLRSPMTFINSHVGAELAFESFVRSVSPDVVHFNHTEHLSTNFVKIARRCTRGPILYTLNEFLPICANLGLMVMSNGRLCDGAEIRKCAQCVGTERDLIERRWALYRDNFADVSLFIAPSEQLKEKFVHWGLSPSRIRYQRYGMKSLPAASSRRPMANSGTRFVYIGQILPHKGVSVLLEAVQELAERPSRPFSVDVHGCLVPDFDEFNQSFLNQLAGLQTHVAFHGEYSYDELPSILAAADVVVVPSTWWENSPLTIQEAFLSGVPVITSNVGGMRELVREGVNGLQFERGSSEDLARKMLSIIEEPGLLPSLRENLRDPGVPSVEEHVRTLTALYRDLPRPSSAAVQTCDPSLSGESPDSGPDSSNASGRAH